MLYLFTHIHALYTDAALSPALYYLAAVVLGFYAFAIVFGRLYTGMHSFTDCGAGVVLGTALWGTYVLARGAVERWVSEGGWSSEFGSCLLSSVPFLGPVQSHPSPPSRTRLRGTRDLLIPQINKMHK